MKLVLLGALSLLSSGVYGLTPAEAQDEFASELAFCAGYYSVGAVASENSGHKEESVRLQPTIQRALELSAKLSTPKKAQARYELAMQSQVKTFKEEGFARLMLQYAAVCKTALERPDERLQYWAGKQ
jgi:hypothetical protein